MQIRSCFMVSIFAVLVCFSDSGFCAAPAKPNIIFILADDLGQGSLGCYGQKLIQTPNLDRMAAEGTLYHSAYCGTSVCAPSRSILMTGLHSGHCPIRGNFEIKEGSKFGAGQLPLPEPTITVAQILKSAGYSTACMGKWGMGQFDTTGSPLKKGFDHFFGYNGQVHAHSYFPTYLHNDEARIELPENEKEKKTYAAELIQNEMLRWIKSQESKPFFLFYATTLPHSKYEIDDLGIYADRKDWTVQQKTYAAMITRLDSDVGELLETLKAKGIDDKTLIMFSGDNGTAANEDGDLGKFFNESMDGKLRGIKRSMYEGGLRQPAMARWPGVVPAGRVTAEPWAFWDFLPTAAELAGASLPAANAFDGVSLVSFLQGGPAPKRDYFYWELHEGSSPKQAVRFGNWKAVRPAIDAPLELFDLGQDLAESTNLASSHPDLIAKAESIMKNARTESANFPWRSKPQTKGKRK
jgi:arylsulfatase A-like enzyme